MYTHFKGCATRNPNRIVNTCVRLLMENLSSQSNYLIVSWFRISEAYVTPLYVMRTPFQCTHTRNTNHHCLNIHLRIRDSLPISTQHKYERLVETHSMVYVNNQSQKSRLPSLQELRRITRSIQNSSFGLIHVLDKILCHLISFKFVDLCVRWKVITPNRNMRTIQLYTSYPIFNPHFTI